MTMSATPADPLSHNQVQPGGGDPTDPSINGTDSMRQVILQQLSGVVVGGSIVSSFLGLFVGFIPSPVVVAVILFSCLLLVLFSRIARLENGRIKQVLLTAWIIFLALDFVAASILFILSKQGLEVSSEQEATLYSVADGFSIPLVQGGSLQQSVLTRGRKITSISIVAGIDRKDHPPKHSTHPFELRVNSESGRMDEFVTSVPDMIPDKLTRFQLPRALPTPTNEKVTIRIINMSPDVVGVYVRKPGRIDRAPGNDGVIIRGHYGVAGEYTNAEVALTGYVTTVR